MSSPIAHGSLIFAVWPYVRHRLDPHLPRAGRTLVGCAVFAALMAPDADLLFGLIYPGQSIQDYHNGPTHSFAASVVFAVLFGGICRVLARGGWLCFTCTGLICYAGHVLLDWFTWGRGVQLFWPLTEARFQSPVKLLMGVRHSVGAELSTHLLTVANDLLFGVVVWLVSRWAWSRFGQRTAGSPAGSTLPE